MAEKIIVMWRDIPAQVIVKKGRKKGKVELSSRFAKAIDRAAMRAGKGSSDDYMADWRRERTVVQATDAELDDIARAEAEQIEAAYSDEKLLELIRAKGLAEN